ncbi:MAG: class A beta-lactamase [Pseudomonadota bacterium]
MARPATTLKAALSTQYRPLRRQALRAAAALPLMPLLLSLPPLPALAVASVDTPDVQASLAALEQDLKGRLGVAAIDTGSGKIIGYRADERFPFCSTFKMMLAAAVLARSAQQPGLMDKRIRYAKSDLVSHAPVTEKYVEQGMTVRELCDATARYSDNPAANLLLAELGGPAALTVFARGIGDTEFRLDRLETALNSAIPGDVRDTTTPAAMMRSLQKLVLGDGLPKAQQQVLTDWLLNNTTGDDKIRAGVPAGWRVADKTGSGAYGASNDIAVLWPPGRAPIVLAIYTTHLDDKAKGRSDIVAAAARAVSAAF